MRKVPHEHNVKVSAGILILFTVAVFLLPWDYLAAWCMAVFIHELFHYVALRLCGCRILSGQICLSGVQLRTEYLSPVYELLCSVAGPLGSLLLIVFLRQFPTLALCGIVQGLYNLLPMYPMDGGRILHSLLSILFSDDVAEKTLHSITVVFRILLCSALLYVYLRWKLGIYPLIVAAFPLLSRKISCKEKALWYNSTIPCK